MRAGPPFLGTAWAHLPSSASAFCRAASAALRARDDRRGVDLPVAFDFLEPRADGGTFGKQNGLVFADSLAATAIGLPFGAA